MSDTVEYGGGDTRALEPSTVDGPGLDHPAASLAEIHADQEDTYWPVKQPTNADIMAAVMALGNEVHNQGRMIADVGTRLDEKLTHQLAGIGAIHQMVGGLVQMLSAVQQVAAMMPGGKRFAKAMAQQVTENGQVTE